MMWGVLIAMEVMSENGQSYIIAKQWSALARQQPKTIFGLEKQERMHCRLMVIHNPT